MHDADAVLEQAIAAFNAQDYDAYEALLTDDFEAYAGVHTPLRFVGKPEWMAFVRGLKRFAAVTHEQRQPASRAYGDCVVLSNGYFVFTTVLHGGDVDVQSGRQSVALVKLDGRWLIANFHFSAMF